VVDLSIVQWVVDVVRISNHVRNLLDRCVVTSVHRRDVMVLWNAVARRRKRDLMSRPGVVHRGVRYCHISDASSVVSSRAEYQPPETSRYRTGVPM